MSGTDGWNRLRERRVLTFILSLAAANGVFSALSWPTNYSLTPMVIDYHFGFGKRGLLGLVLRLIDHPPYHYATLAWMSFAVLAAWVALLACLVWRLARNDSAIAAAVLLFLLSLGFASLVSDAGRGEQFGVLAAIVCLLLPATPAATLGRAALLCAAVLVHEANVLIAVPVAAFDVWIGPASRPIGRRSALAAVAALPATLLTSRLGNLRTGCNWDADLAFWQPKVADFTLSPIAVGPLCNDGLTNVRLVIEGLWLKPEYAMLFPMALALTLPSSLFYLHLLWRVCRNRLVLAGGVAAALAPVALLAVGVDVVRFVTLIQLCSLLALASASRRLGLPAGGLLRPTPAWRLALIGLTALELGSAMPLNNGAPPLKFPYTELIRRAVLVSEGKEPFVPRH